MTLLPRLIRLRDAPAYLGMDRNRFNAEVRPLLTEIPIGEQEALRQHRMTRVFKRLAEVDSLSGERG